MPTIKEALGIAINLQAAGRLDEAEGVCRDILAHAPSNGNALHLMGRMAHQRGRLEEARGWLSQVVDLFPDVAPFHHGLGLVLRDLGQVDAAVSAYEKAIALAPDENEAWISLAAVLRGQGRDGEALALLEQAVSRKHGDAERYFQLGNQLYRMQRFAEAEQAYLKAHALRPDHGETLNNLGNACEALAHLDDAMKWLSRAAELNPDWPVPATNLAKVVGRLVPAWHVPMMNDDDRNQAYEAALRRAIKPHHQVLEIGTGAGLLAMMAARTGAARVTTCEMVTSIAECAAEIVARNGYGDRVTVVPKASNELVVGADLPEPADVLVSEILSNELLNEGVIPSLEDAKARLLKPDAVIIPCEGAIRCVLAGGDYIARNMYVDTVAGFDVTPFNRLNTRRNGIDLRRYGYEAFSPDFQAFHFDFARGRRFPEERKVAHIPVIRTGRCHGVLQWIWLKMDAESEFENHPARPTMASGWQHMLYRFPQPLDLRKGQTVRLSLVHNRAVPWFHVQGVDG